LGVILADFHPTDLYVFEQEATGRNRLIPGVIYFTTEFGVDFSSTPSGINLGNLNLNVPVGIEQ
jgi:hypothetical protein